MKKQNLLIIIAVVCLLVAIILIIFFYHPAEEKTKDNYLKEISYAQMLEKFNKKDSFILFIGAQNCTHCLNFKPTLEKALQTLKQEAYYVDVYLFSKSEHNTLFSYVNYTGTPTVAFIINGKEDQMRRLTGDPYTEQDVINRIKKAGFAK